VDIVNVFRRSEYLEGVVEDAIEVGAKAVWAQLGVIDPDAADKANNAHIDMVMDKCIKVEYARLMD
jgi:predicted CoA-binding protein